jgi:hypothetical protein
MFDWTRFLRQHHIEFIERGGSTTRNNVNIRCPMCADSDKGFHLGISLKGKGWNCWRNVQHRGRSRSRLIQLLLKCSEQTARELAGTASVDLPVDVDLGQQMRSALYPDEAPRSHGPLRLLSEFKPLVQDGFLAKPFWFYLRERGYRDKQIEWLCQSYQLHYATRGPFSYRIIIPIYDRRGKLMTWVARSIRPQEEVRYKALSVEPVRELPAALAAPYQMLLGLPLLWRCPDSRVLVVCEGPFDALWITTYGRSFGVYGTCLFGLNLSEAQQYQLSDLQERFEREVLLLDSEASFQAFRLSQSGNDLRVIRLSENVKDPAELPSSEVISLCSRLAMEV